MILFKLWRYLRRTERVYSLPPDLVTDYDKLSLTEDDILILTTGYAKDLHGIEKLKEKYGAETALELIPRLPKRKPPSLKKRFIAWLQRIEGGYPYDPTRRILRGDGPVQYRIHSGYSETDFNYGYSDDTP